MYVGNRDAYSIYQLILKRFRIKIKFCMNVIFLPPELNS